MPEIRPIFKISHLFLASDQTMRVRPAGLRVRMCWAWIGEGMPRRGVLTNTGGLPWIISIQSNPDLGFSWSVSDTKVLQ